MKKAILVVSFGTTYEETRRKTIDCIEKEIAQTYPEFHVYHAWTNPSIRKKLQQHKGIVIPDVQTAMEQIFKKGNEIVIVQPTYVLDGMENQKMRKKIMAYANQFLQIVIANPLLTTQKDKEQTAMAIIEELKPKQDEFFVLMGHGTEYEANVIYTEMNDIFANKGYSNIYIGTLEAYPSLEDVLQKLNHFQMKKVILLPFMIVSGRHAHHHLAGEQQDSWKNQLKSQGYDVSCILKGLGEYLPIRKIVLCHTKEAIQKLKWKARD